MGTATNPQHTTSTTSPQLLFENTEPCNKLKLNTTTFFLDWNLSTGGAVFLCAEHTRTLTAYTLLFCSVTNFWIPFLTFLLWWPADSRGRERWEWCRRKKTMICNKGMWSDFNPDLQYMACTKTKSTTRMAKFLFRVMSSSLHYYPALALSFLPWLSPPPPFGSFNTGPPHDFPSQKLLL